MKKKKELHLTKDVKYSISKYDAWEIKKKKKIYNLSKKAVRKSPRYG